MTSDNVADLPLNGRDLVDLTLMQSGVTQSSVFSLTNTVGATNIRWHHVQRATARTSIPNNYILDGAIMTQHLWPPIVTPRILGTTLLGVDGVKNTR